jgi:hypothetical protein
MMSWRGPHVTVSMSLPTTVMRGRAASTSSSPPAPNCEAAPSGAAGVPPPHGARLALAVDGVPAGLLREVETRIGRADGVIE